MKLAIGIDIGGTNTKLGIVREDSTTIAHSLFSTKKHPEFNSFIARLIKETENLLKSSQLDISQIEGIGVGAPNANFQTGKIESPTNLSWETSDLATPLKKQFNTTIKVDNDANVAAFGEKFLGDAKHSRDFIVITLGTGVGTGVFCNGQILRGSNAIASEGGHIKIFDNSRICGCSGSGHLESYASLSGIKLTAKEITSNDYRFREIVSLYEKGDKSIQKVVEIAANQLAQGLSVMGCLFAPEKIILAGGVTMLGDSFSFLVKKYYEEYIYPPFRNSTEISISKISKEQGAYSAAASLILFGN